MSQSSMRMLVTLETGCDLKNPNHMTKSAFNLRLFKHPCLCGFSMVCTVVFFKSGHMGIQRYLHLCWRTCCNKNAAAVLSVPPCNLVFSQEIKDKQILFYISPLFPAFIRAPLILRWANEHRTYKTCFTFQLEQIQMQCSCNIQEILLILYYPQTYSY